MSGSAKSTQATWMQSGPEAWVRGEGRQLYEHAKNSAWKPYEQYGGERVAEYGADMQSVRDVIAKMQGPNADVDSARSMFQQVADANDPSKGIDRYMDPYVGQVLDPVLTRLREQGAMARNQIGGQAAMSGAFGDSRHGIENALQRSNEMRDVGETTSKLYSDAFRSALSADAASQGRYMGAAQGMFGLGQFDNANDQTIARMFADLGERDRIIRQAQNDVRYQDFTDARDWDMSRSALLMNILNATPSLQVQTGFTQNKQDTGGAGGLIGQLAGTILGSIIGGPAGGTLGGRLLGTLGGALGGGAAAPAGGGYVPGQLAPNQNGAPLDLAQFMRR